MNINLNQQNYYEIISYNYENILFLDYLIEIEENNIFKDKNTLFYYIYNQFIKKELNHLSYKKNQFSFDNNNFIIKIHSKNDINQDSDIDEEIINKKRRDKMYTFYFMTVSQLKITLQIEYNKNINDLRKLFFEKINRLDLLYDENIYFLYNGVILPNEDLLERYFKDKELLRKILVVDREDRL